MCKLCHYCAVRSGKDCIGFCQSFQLVALCLHSLHDYLYVFNHLIMLFWRGGWCTVDVLHCRNVPYFSLGCYHSFLLSVPSVEKHLYFAHVLRSAGFCLHSLMSSLKISVCARRVIPFDIIMASEIVWIPAPVNSLPFYNCSIIRTMSSAGLYGPIILTTFSSRLILSIAP